MTNISILGVSLYQLFCYFMIYSVMGWIMETILVSIQQHRLVKRGFLYGCYCPIYGVGMCLIILLLTPLKRHPALLFLGGMLLATALEYFTSWAMERLFHARWWDYSHNKFNLHGRVCLGVSVAWGGLSFVIIWGLQPLVDAQVSRIPLPLGEYLVYGVYGLFALDLVLSLVSAFQLSSKIRSLGRIREELMELLEQSGVLSGLEEARARMAKSGLNEAFTLKSEAIRARLNAAGPKAAAGLSAFEGLRERYKQLMRRARLGERRVLRAYPHFKVTRWSELTDELRAKLKRGQEGGGESE